MKFYIGQRVKKARPAPTTSNDIPVGTCGTIVGGLVPQGTLWNNQLPRTMRDYDCQVQYDGHVKPSLGGDWLEPIQDNKQKEEDRNKVISWDDSCFDKNGKYKEKLHAN